MSFNSIALQAPLSDVVLGLPASRSLLLIEKGATGHGESPALS